MDRACAAGPATTASPRRRSSCAPRCSARSAATTPPATHASDLNMWLRIAAVSDVAYVRGAAQALYRVHPEGMLRSMLSSAGDRDRPARAPQGLRALLRLGRRELPERRRAARGGRPRAGPQALWRASRAYDRGLTAGAGRAAREELVAFALETCPEARRLREWRGLRLRRRIGAGRSRSSSPSRHRRRAPPARPRQPAALARSRDLASARDRPPPAGRGAALRLLPHRGEAGPGGATAGGRPPQG